MLYSGILTALLALPLLANAYRNVTYVSKDPELVYRPAGVWRDWRAGECPAWQTGGQWTDDPTGSITLRFVGVAVYAYGLWDDPENPVYSFQIDNEAPVIFRNTINPNPRSCDPMFSKTGLDSGSHTIVFRMTDTRPNDVKDLSFEGFIVTVADAGDAPTNDSSKKPPIAIIVAAVGGVVAMIAFALALFCFWRRRRNKNNVASQQMAGSAVPLVVGGYNQPPMADPSIPAPTPFILPPNREPSPYLPPASSPWSPSPNDHRSYYSEIQYGPLHAPSHVSYAPSPSNEGYGGPYGVQGAPPANAGQAYHPNPTNTGFYSKQSPQRQHTPDQGQHQGPVQQQLNYAWIPPNSPPPGPPQSDISYQSREEASSSMGRSTTAEEPRHQSPSVRNTKGAMDPTASPVLRNEKSDLQNLGPKRDSRGGEAPPPEYGAF